MAYLFRKETNGAVTTGQLEAAAPHFKKNAMNRKQLVAEYGHTYAKLAELIGWGSKADVSKFLAGGKPGKKAREICELTKTEVAEVFFPEYFLGLPDTDLKTALNIALEGLEMAKRARPELAKEIEQIRALIMKLQFLNAQPVAALNGGRK